MVWDGVTVMFDSKVTCTLPETMPVEAVTVKVPAVALVMVDAGCTCTSGGRRGKGIESRAASG